jgi:hypothetical protein
MLGQRAGRANSCSSVLCSLVNCVYPLGECIQRWKRVYQRESEHRLIIDRARASFSGKIGSLLPADWPW